MNDAITLRQVSRRRAQAVGAFYTRDDVASYIARFTIIPFVLDAAAERGPSAFVPGSPLWRLIKNDPDRYLSGSLQQSTQLPRENAVEHEARRHRCVQLRQQLRRGLVRTVNDLVTFNLDIVRFLLDVLATADANLVSAIADAVDRITILDPTCGNGAFLLAALDLLEIIHRQCRDRLRLPMLSSGRLRQLIVRKNLFGIDLRDEAAAECRHKLGIDCTGNSGPGASIRCADAITANWTAEFPLPMRGGGFDVVIGNPPYLRADPGHCPADFRTRKCPDIYAGVLEQSVRLLRPRGRCGMIVPLSLGFSASFDACRQVLLDHCPTSWFASFGRIPAALFASDIRIRNTIYLGTKLATQGADTHTSEIRGADTTRSACYSTRLHRWFLEARPHLLDLLEYAPFDPHCWKGRVPKCDSGRLLAALQTRLQQTTNRLADRFSREPTAYRLYYKQTAYNWLTFCRKLPPCRDAAGRPIAQTQFDVLHFHSARERDAGLLFLNGKWMYAFWSIVGDDFHVARWMIGDFPIDLADAAAFLGTALRPLARRLERAMAGAIAFKRNAGKQVGTFNLARCRHITDESDRLFATYLGMEPVWPDLELHCARIVKTDFGSPAVATPPS